MSIRRREAGSESVPVVEVGRYRIISRLGAGGMGEAFRAWDSVAGVPVVLKRPLPMHSGRRDVLERFDREITRLLDLPHPHVVPIVGHGHDTEGVPFLVMRFLPGGSLADRTKPQPAMQLHRWLPGIAAALDFAHSCKVLHRDVKPGNIFFDAHGQPFLGDFGIAKVIEDEVSGRSEEALTGTSENLGTSAYMAPEFFRQPRVLTGAYDQYALGITTFEMICGKRPFSGDSGQLIVAHVTQLPPDIRGFFPDAPASFCDAMARVLAKTSEHRFPSCTEFAAAVLADVPALSVDERVYRFMCPGCRKLVRVPPEFGGRGGKCTQCGARLRVAPNLDALWLREEDPLCGDRVHDPDTHWAPPTEHAPARPRIGSESTEEKTALTEIVREKPVHRPRRAVPGLLFATASLVILVGGVIGGLQVFRGIGLAGARRSGDWTRVLSLRPDDQEALVNRALESLDDIPPRSEAAFADLEKARRVDPKYAALSSAFARAHAARAIEAVEINRLEAAEKDLGEAIGFGVREDSLSAVREGIGTGYLNRLRVAIREGRLVDARNCAAKAGEFGVRAAELNPLRSELGVLEAESLEAGGSRERALKAVAEAIALDESAALQTLEKSSRDAFRTAAHEQFYRKSLEESFAKSDWEQALAVIEKAKAIDPESPQWLATKIAANPEKLATMSARALEDLPESVLEAIPESAVGSLPAIENSLGMGFRFIPAGGFLMGEGSEDPSAPSHLVRLTKPYFLGSHEVTNSQWQRIMGSAPSRWTEGSHPVHRVSWHEAREFCVKLSALPDELRRRRVYRLPTEAEWEHACRAGTTTRFAFGAGESVESADAHGWFANNSGLQRFDPEYTRQTQGRDAYLTQLNANKCQTHPVGQKTPNPWGLHDMHGNVFEWCSDFHAPYPVEESTDPAGPSVGGERVFRGGSWYFDLQFAGSAARLGGKESFRRDDLGLRVVFTIRQ